MPPTVLVADDNRTTTRTLGTLVERWGYQPVLAFDGAEALAILEGQAVDVVITDLRMPAIDGMELLARLQERWQQIGDIEGPDGSQDNEAEFDLVKQKATLLYSVPLSKRVLLSTYAEWIHKDFDDEERLKQRLPRRTDTLLLTSGHLRIRLNSDLSLKLRYLYRGNRSSVDLLEYGNHIAPVGFEFRPRRQALAWA